MSTRATLRVGAAIAGVGGAETPQGPGPPPTAARDVATQLQALGFVTAAIDRLRAGRKVDLTITATTPT